MWRGPHICTLVNADPLVCALANLLFKRQFLQGERAWPRCPRKGEV